MEVSPQSVAGATFNVVKKGFDPDEVRGFLGQVAQSLSQANDHAASMESRARQAVARMQEAQQAAAAAAHAPNTAVSTTKLDDTETISRTLLLAQRTADMHIAGARQEAADLLSDARDEADVAIRQAHDQADEILADSRVEGRRVADAERLVAESELQQLLARLEFLRDDVEQMEAHASSQRERLRNAAVALAEFADESLSSSRAPTLSAASDEQVHVKWEASGPESADQDDASYEPWTPDDESEGATDFADEQLVSEFEAPDLDGRAPTPAYGYGTSPDSEVLGFQLPAYDDVDSIPAIDPAPGFGEDITAEVPVIRTDSSRGAMRIFGDEL